MKEFMLIIRSTGDLLASLSADQKKTFLTKVQNYIGKLNNEGKLIGAQPLERQGKLISGTQGALEVEPFNETRNVIVGYYHIFANDLDEAISIAKANPEFEFGSMVQIEVRPVKMKEELINMEYH